MFGRTFRSVQADCLAVFRVDSSDRRFTGTEGLGARVKNHCAKQSRERDMLLVIEVLLIAKDDDLVAQQCFIDALHCSGIQVAAEVDTVDAGSDMTAELGHSERHPLIFADYGLGRASSSRSTARDG